MVTANAVSHADVTLTRHATDAVPACDRLSMTPLITPGIRANQLLKAL